MLQLYSFSLKIDLAIWGLFWFHTNFRTVFLFLFKKKKATGILVGIPLNLWITLGNRNILIISKS